MKRVPSAMVLGVASLLATTACAVGGDGTEDEFDQTEAAVAGCTITISSQESTVVLGQTIHLSAVASCPGGPAEIAWYQRTLRRPFNTLPTFDFDTTGAPVGATPFYAIARQQGTSSPLTTSNIVTVTVNDNVPACTAIALNQPTTGQVGQVGVPMTVRATATCPGAPEYQYWVKRPTDPGWTFLPGYFPGSSTWTPPASGQWYVASAARVVGAHVQYSVKSMAALVTINVAPVNHPPVATDDTLSTFQRTPASVDVLANDTDQDGDGLTITMVGGGSNGTATFSGPTVTYTPNPGFVGTDIVSYIVDDGHGGTDLGDINVTVTDRAPVAVDDAIVTTVHTQGAVDVLANDSDPDGDALTILSFTQGSSGGVSFTGSVATYTPNFNFAGSDSFSYTIDDGQGGVTSAFVVVTVDDRAPDAVDDDLTVAANDSAIIAPMDNDSDPDFDELFIVQTTQGAHGSVSATSFSVTYTPNANYVGADSFTYTIADPYGMTDTATVAVTVTNRLPIAVDDSLITAKNTPGTVDVLANDSDPNGDPLTIIDASGASHGSMTFTGGAVTYTPNSGYSGPDQFFYTITDGQGGFGSAAVNVMVTNQPPVANNDALTTTTNTPKTVDVLANDSDPNGDALSIFSFTQGAHGSVSFTGGVATYTPNPGYTGGDSFGYTIDDGAGGQASATVTVTINAAVPGCTISISSQESAVVYGNVIHLSATASCNTGPAQVQWYQRVVVQPYSSNPSLNFTANQVGALQFYAQARTQGTISPVATSNVVTVTVTDNVPACTMVTMTSPANNSNATVGTPVTVSAVAQCPGPPEYQYWVKTVGASTWTFLPGYFPGASSWTPPSAGDWYVASGARVVGAHVQYSQKSNAVLVHVAP